MSKYIWLYILIFVIGLWLRVDTFQNKHPDQDELFELVSLKDKQLSSVFDNKAFYGDHTSFPGEFLLYYFPMKMVLHDPAIDVGKMTVTGMERNDFWKLAVPKIALWLLGTTIFFILSLEFGFSGLLAFAIWNFNYQLVYHAFEMRPYSVLPVLAVLNYYMCNRRSGIVGDVVHVFLVFFTCIYHAYGPMIAFLPLFLNDITRNRVFWLACLAGIGLWIFYAVYSNFGFSPNAVQSQVDPFQYMPKQFFFENLLRQLTGGSLIFYATIPLLAWKLFHMNTEDWWLLGLFVILPIALICLVDIKTHYWIHPRQYIWVIPFFALFLGRIWNEWCYVKR